MPRPPELRPYRVFVYLLFGVLSALASVLILRSVVGDLFGQARAGSAARPATAAGCVDDVGHLFSAISARAAQPAADPASEAAALEWDRWSRGWEDELFAVSSRCRMGPHLDAAIDGLENLRRELNRSGQQIGLAARLVKEQLDLARAALKPRQ